MELFSKVESFYDNLSNREQKLIVLSIFMMILFISSVLIFLISDSFTKREERIKDLKSSINLLKKNRKYVEESKRILANYEMKATRKPPMLQGYLDEIANSFKLESASYNPKKSEELGTYKEYLKESVEVKFHDVDLKKISKFMDKIEKSTNLLMVTELKITSRKGQRDRLDPSLIISSFYKRSAKELRERDKKLKSEKKKKGK